MRNAIVRQQIPDKVKNPVREHGASSMEKAIYIWGADRPQTHMAIHPRSEERGILAFSRKRCLRKQTQPSLRYSTDGL